MSIAMLSSGCSGPWIAWATWTSSPVWCWNRSTVCAAWCQSRWSVQLRGWPSAFMFVRRKKYVCTSICWIDSSPAAIRRRIHWCDGLNRRVCPTMQVRPVSRCMRSTSCASAQLSASGISTWTCLPARSVAMACHACSWVGVARITASTSSRARASSRLVEAWPTPYFRATSSAWSCLRLITDVTVTPSMAARASRCLMPKAPAPASAIRMVSSLPRWFCGACSARGVEGGSSPLGLAGLEHQVPDGGVRPGDVVEAVQFLDLGAEGTTHDQLHDQLDPLGAGLAHVLDVRQAGQALGICDEPVHERVVERGVDEARPRPLELVAHAAGTPDVNRNVLGEALHGPADRLAQTVAAVAGRGRVLHDVDGERDDPHRPLPGLAVDQGQRHGEAVVDVELVQQGEVELVEDERLREVRGQVGMTADDRHGAGPVALVRRRELVGAAERERGDDLRCERGHVVVVDEDHHIGEIRRRPRLSPVVPGEQRLPVRLLRLAEIDRGTDGRDVACRQSGGDAGHVRFRPAPSASPRASARRAASSAGNHRCSFRSSWTPPGGS